jgi:transcriptional regulator with XRE-family HTH domain
MKLTQDEMASLLGMSKKCYINIENGRVSPRADILYILANIINVNVAYFYHDKDRYTGEILSILKGNVSNENSNILTLIEIMLNSEMEIINDKNRVP